GRPTVNDLWLSQGRFPDPDRRYEVLANSAFMEAHDYPLGTEIAALINGRHVPLTIVGVALSPEYTYTLAPGAILPDDRRFGVFWIRREALASAFDMRGAFNDVSLRLAPTAQVQDVIERTDRVLAPYGGLGAIKRLDQLSAFFLQNELTQLQAFSIMVPSLFLAVAAFLLNVVFGRLIAAQRGDIAALKAFGYRDWEVGLHYAKMLAVVLLAGWILGCCLGYWLGSSLTQMYGIYYRFPELSFGMGMQKPLIALGVSALGAAIGAFGAIRRTVKIPPAEAMRPEAPPVYKRTLAERLGLAKHLPTAPRIVLRELERKPMRTLFSVTGVVMATSLTVVMAFTMDSMVHMSHVQFGLIQREDVQLTLVEPRSTAVLAELEHLPGVVHAEPYRSVPVQMSAGRRTKKISIEGIPTDAQLISILDQDLRRLSLPKHGLVMARKLAEVLNVSAGDWIQVKILEGDRRVRRVQVAQVIETFIGMSAYMSLPAVSELLGQTETLNGARLLIDDSQLGPLHAAVKRTPMIAGVTSRDTVLRQMRKMLDDNMGTFVFFSVAFSIVLAFAVLHNTARISLADRARELATLRVLGFRRSEVSAILIGELAVVTLVAIPIGLLVGYGLSSILVRSPGYDTEQFRLPLVVTSATYALATGVVLTAATVSGWSAWRTLDRFDIVEVLKTRD
ncbi:MAG: FtsX-like permease family protein, partial [Planctomycetota bacterium]|nr:FtsX-like permease family protein [Planctomycetota bacterium]